ncbi:MAG: hypothetical protein MPL62_15055, partial [Alphaproteobacteria bacterium]|nr:hypothetical protein [Alphaproteobacteria bacterium]
NAQYKLPWYRGRKCPKAASCNSCKLTSSTRKILLVSQGKCNRVTCSKGVLPAVLVSYMVNLVG